MMKSRQPFAAHTQPDVSLVIPTYERPAALVVAVRSGLAAIPENGELIVVDDGTENSATDSLQHVSDERLRIEKTPGRQGPSRARNLGVSFSNSDLVFFLDDDDILLPDYVARVLKMRDMNDPAPVFGFSAVLRSGSTSGSGLKTGPMHQGQTLSSRLGGLGMGFWIERSLYIDLGGLDETIRVNEDTEFCLRLANENILGWYEADPGVDIDAARTKDSTQDAPSVTKTSVLADRAKVFEMLLRKYSDLFSEHPKTRARFVERVLKYTCQSEGFARALERAKGLQLDRPIRLLIPKLILWRTSRLLGNRRRAR